MAMLTYHDYGYCAPTQTKKTRDLALRTIVVQTAKSPLASDETKGLALASRFRLAKPVWR